MKTHHFHTKMAYQKPMTNRMVSTKVTYHKERSFASNYFIFFENFVTVLEPLIKSWFDVPPTQMPIFVLFVSAGVLFDGAFSLWVSLKKGHLNLFVNIRYRLLSLGRGKELQKPRQKLKNMYIIYLLRIFALLAIQCKWQFFANMY